MGVYNVSVSGNLSFLNGIMVTDGTSVSYTLNSGVASSVKNPVFLPGGTVAFTLQTSNRNYRFTSTTSVFGLQIEGNVVGPKPNSITGGDEDDPWVATARVSEEELAVAAPRTKKKPAKKKAAKKPAKKAAKKAAKKPAKKAAKKAAKKPAKKAAKKAAKKPVKKAAKKAAKKPVKKAAKKR